MTPRSLRRAALALVAVGLLLGLTACSDPAGGGAALEVNGEALSYADFQAELQAYADNELALQAFEAQGIPTAGESSESLSSAMVAQLATTRVAYMLIDAELDERGIEVTQSDIDAAIEQLRIDPNTGQPAEDSAFDAFPGDFQRQVAADRAAVTALQAAFAEDPPEVPEPTEDEIDAALAAQSGEGSACISAVLAASREQADAALARVEAGEDIVDVALEVNPQQGGDLGCLTPGTNPAEIEEVFFSLEVGEVSEVVELPADLTGGQPIFLVAQRNAAPSREQVIEQLVAQAEASASDDPVTAFVVPALADADVTVASRYGTWDVDGANGPSVVPPEGPTTTVGPVPENPNSPIPAPTPTEGG